MIKLLFTTKELAILNKMIGIALLSGEIEFDKTAESIHNKVTREIYEQTQNKSGEKTITEK